MNNNSQVIAQAKGRPMLHWAGKRPLERIEYYPAQEKEVYGQVSDSDFNGLYWGDNLQVLAHLLKNYRSQVDLIYIDPPFDSKAEYVKKVKIRNQKVTGQPQSLFEEKQYTDIWEKDEYLQFMYERLTLLRELLSEKGTIYLHCDWHKNAYLKVLMDEIFDGYEFAEIIWVCGLMGSGSFYPKSHETIYCYKSPKAYFNPPLRLGYSPRIVNALQKDEDGWYYTRGRESSGGTSYLKSYISDNPNLTKEEAIKEATENRPQTVWDVWMGKKELAEAFNDHLVGTYAFIESESTDYPTQKPRELLERIITASSKEGALVLDCFVGSGTTALVAQQLGRRWLACDINLGAIQTTTKRLNKLLTGQLFDTRGFKVYNVNDYEVFKNELEAKTIVMDTYGIEPIRLSYFDGILDNHFVKIMPLNRVLNKLDIKNILRSIEERIDTFTIKPSSKSGEAVYEQGVIIICSGKELDVDDYLKKENKTGVEIEIRDLQTDKQSLTFKRPPEAKIAVKLEGNTLSVAIEDFHSPMLMQKLELENAKALSAEQQATVDDYRQIIDSVAIDVDYNGRLFNAEIVDIPAKQEMVAGNYSWKYEKPVNGHHVAVKIVDVLGEEYFETFKV